MAKRTLRKFKPLLKTLFPHRLLSMAICLSKAQGRGAINKWGKRRKGPKEYQKLQYWSKMGGDYSLGSNFSNYPLPQSS